MLGVGHRQPQAVVAWHRMGFRLFWAWKARRGQPGCPAMARETKRASQTAHLVTVLLEEPPVRRIEFCNRLDEVAVSKEDALGGHQC